MREALVNFVMLLAVGAVGGFISGIAVGWIWRAGGSLVNRFRNRNAPLLVVLREEDMEYLTDEEAERMAEQATEHADGLLVPFLIRNPPQDGLWSKVKVRMRNLFSTDGI